MKSRVSHTKNHHTASNPITLNCLQGNDVITKRLSDHHPVIHDGVLLWNIMKPGNKRNGNGYNNGFGIVENEKTYQERLFRIAKVVAEIVMHHPEIEIIGFCEGPIQKTHIAILLDTFAKYPSMHKFLRSKTHEETFYRPDIKEYPNQGILMLADKKYSVHAIDYDTIKNPILFKKLANRLQLWRLMKNNKAKYIGLAHLPFSGDEAITVKEKLSADGETYSTLINALLKQHANDRFIFCADFNLNPYLIGTWQDRILDQITTNNSILFHQEKESAAKSTISVTVDGILLSQHEKQRYETNRFNPGLFARLRKEHDLCQSSCQQFDAESKSIIPYNQSAS